MLKRNLAMLAGVVALAILPLYLHSGGPAEFGGADGEAQNAITEISPDYQPWAIPLWTPPSKEIESLLFALQAAIGAGLVGFYFGRRTAPNKSSDSSKS